MHADGFTAVMREISSWKRDKKQREERVQQNLVYWVVGRVSPNPEGAEVGTLIGDMLELHKTSLRWERVVLSDWEGHGTDILFRGHYFEGQLYPLRALDHLGKLNHHLVK